MSALICEVGPRDGLQNEPATLAPQTRAELVGRLAHSGLGRIEAVSFVHPQRVPQMAAAERVVELIDHDPGVVYAGLALNMRGYERFVATALDEVHLVVAATDSFSKRNSNTSRADAVTIAIAAIAAAARDSRRATVTIAVAFGCPFEGCVDGGTVTELVARFVDAGADEICLADTIGVAAPREVAARVAAAARAGARVGVHLHNTRNGGYANAFAALEAGAIAIDASVGGLGGCPFAPGATGNIATEDLVYLLERDGIDTGVDLDRLCETAAWLETVLGKQLPGQLYRVGPAPAGNGVHAHARTCLPNA